MEDQQAQTPVKCYFTDKHIKLKCRLTLLFFFHNKNVLSKGNNHGFPYVSKVVRPCLLSHREGNSCLLQRTLFHPSAHFRKWTWSISSLGAPPPQMVNLSPLYLSLGSRLGANVPWCLPVDFQGREHRLLASPVLRFMAHNVT